MGKNKTKNQHYVPKFLLRKFLCNAKIGQIYVFDKKKGESFKTNIDNISSENNFYDFKFKDLDLTFEPALCDLESRVANIHGKILCRQSIDHLTTEDKIWLAYFIVIQRIRTRNYREVMRDMTNSMIEEIQDMGVDPNSIKGQKIETENDAKLLTARIFHRATNSVPHLLNKAWILLRTTKDKPFYISDNPVTLQNQRDFGPRGNVGFAVSGIEIYLPLSRTLALFLTCPTNEADCREGLRRAREIHRNLRMTAMQGRRFGAFDEWGLAVSQQVLTNTGPFVEAMDTGAALDSDAENVINFNFLQTVHAERFVMSSRDEFGLVRTMLRDDEGYRWGPRAVII